MMATSSETRSKVSIRFKARELDGASETKEKGSRVD